MKMRTFIPSIKRLTSLGMVLAVALGLAQAASADTITRVYVVIVPPPQDQEFNQGIKDWEKCLHDHGAKQATLAYSAQTGDLNRYLFLETHSSWAEMDHHEAAGKACGAVFTGEVVPHASQAYSEVAVLNSKESYMPGGDADPAPMIWVDAFRIKPGHMDAFSDAAKKYTAAAAKTHWEGHFSGWDIQGAGQGAEDFVLVWPNKNWADIGHDPSPSIKQMMESVYGKKAAAAIHEDFVTSLADSWSDAWSYEKDLSYTPAE